VTAAIGPRSKSNHIIVELKQGRLDVTIANSPGLVVDGNDLIELIRKVRSGTRSGAPELALKKWTPS
jgi:hypothetical protein